MSEINGFGMGPNEGRAKAEFDQARAERAITELLIALGEDPNRDGLRDTPARVARALKKTLKGFGKIHAMYFPQLLI